MAEKIKKFFQKKKADAKFKIAGPGHKLTDSSSSSLNSNQGRISNVSQKRIEPSDATRQAAEAALARLNVQRKDTAFNTSLAAIQAQVRRELEAEKKLQSQNTCAENKVVETIKEVSPLLAVKGNVLKTRSV